MARNKSKSRPDQSNKDFRKVVEDSRCFRKNIFYMTRFEFSEFTNANFSSASIKDSCFIKANLQHSDFTSAILKRVNFSGADLREVKFCNAKLEHVDFSGSLVDGANFVGASIKNCKGLKLSEEQTRLVEKNKEKDRERSRQDLEKRKALPEYREKEKSRILLKPYVDSVIYNEERIAVYLKSSYLFIDTQTNSKEFKSFSEVKEGLGKNKVFVQ